MRQLAVGILLLVMAVSGCANQHEKDKQAAMVRWNKARAEVTINVARGQFEKGNLERAAITCQNILNTHPDYAPGHLLLGRINLEKDRLSKAGERFARCLEIEPKNAEAKFYLGVIHERSNRLDEAFGYYHQAWLDSNDQSSYLLAAVETKMAQGKSEEALTLLQENREKIDDELSYLVIEGNILENMGRFEEAGRAFKGARAIEPENEVIKEMLAFSLYHAGQSQEALGLFEELLDRKGAKAQNKEVWSYQLAMGDCYMKLKQYHRAQRCYEQVSEHDGNNPQIWTRMSQVELARGNLEQAEKCAQKARSLQKDNTDALMAIGYVAMQQGHYQLAEDIFKQVISIDSEHGLAYCMMGQCLQKRGKQQEAKVYFEQALKIDPDDSLAQRLWKSEAETATSNHEEVKTY
jgi:tetratricopeptide (TPR) repeat protein